MAGWISWAAGFIVGILPLVPPKVNIPAAPLVAFIVGAVLYFALAKAGMESKVIETAAAPAESAPEQQAPAKESKED
jgi:hypothetical protein